MLQSSPKSSKTSTTERYGARKRNQADREIAMKPGEKSRGFSDAQDSDFRKTRSPGRDVRDQYALAQT